MKHSNYSMSPALGEQIAASGYRYQYLVSAALILRSLREERLQWIRLKDVRAGRVDDLIIGSDNRVDAYQIKHRSRPITFRGLVAEDQDEANGSTDQAGPLIRQLADGWTRLKAYLGPVVVVHLVTNAVGSTHDRIESVTASEKPRNFSSFLREVWEPLRDAPPTAAFQVPHKWATTWERLCGGTALSDPELRDFVRCCELDFDTPELPSVEGVVSRDHEQLLRDLRQLSQWLLDTAATRESSIQLTRDELLSRLGWRNRFRPKNPHEFPVDSALYQPLSETVGELENALSTLTKGYVGVFGPPGSGKSTLLTHTLRFRPERVIRYYAYVRDDPNIHAGRGEAVNFLHDIVVALEHEGFKGGESPPTFDRHELADRFRRQLMLLNEDWRTNQTKTILLVDGLDHIDREEHPDRSLLLEFPHPDHVPEGVILVLGSQTDSILSAPLQFEVRKRERRLTVRPMDRRSVMELLEKSGVPFPLTIEQRERVFSLTGGHPLAVMYLLSQLKSMTIDDLDHVLGQEVTSYGPDIEAYYHQHWRQFEDDLQLVRVLAYIARLRSAIDLSWLEGWCNREAIDKVRSRFSHFFRREAPDRWYFFHNSFRLFLLRRTSESPPGEYDPHRNAQFYREIAECCAAEPAASPWAWEEVFHRSNGGQHDAVLLLSTQEYFRNQFENLRPADAINVDIKLGLEAARVRSDALAFCRLVLASAELQQRTSNLDRSALISLLIELGDIPSAVEHLREGFRLRCSQKAALEASVELFEADHIEEARRLFDLAEPVNLLQSPYDADRDGVGDDAQTLDSWATAAALFRSPEDTIEIIQRMSAVSSVRNRTEPTLATNKLRARLLFHFGLGLLRQRKWPELDAISDVLLGVETDASWWFWLQAHAWRQLRSAGDIPGAEARLSRVLGRFLPHDLESMERIVTAEGIYRIRDDTALAMEWLDGIVQPDIVPGTEGSRSGFSPFLHRFWLNRLRFTLGDTSKPSALVPDPEDPRYFAIVRFERLVCVVARVWAAAWRRENVPAPLILGELAEYFDLFERHHTYASGTGWFIAERARGELLEILIEAVEMIGGELLHSLRDLLEEKWFAREDDGRAWTVHDRRNAITAFFANGLSLELAQEALHALEEPITKMAFAFDRIREWELQAKAWIALGDEVEARNAIRALLTETNSIGSEKDYQLDYWIEWLGEVGGMDTDKTADWVGWFARAIVDVRRTTEDGAWRSAATSLLEVAFRWSPVRGTRLFEWLLEHRLVHYEAGLSTLLRTGLDNSAFGPEIVSSFIREVIVPISTDGYHVSLLTALAKSQKTAAGSESAVSELLGILAHTEVVGIPSARSQWRKSALEAALAAGLFHAKRFSDLLIDRHRNGGPNDDSSLRLQDGTRLAPTEVLARAQTVGDLVMLHRQQASSSYFRWSPVVRKVLPDASAHDVAALAEEFGQVSDSSSTLASCAARFLEIGERSSAATIATQLLQLEPYVGWDRRWGGTKVEAARLLADVDRRSARSLVFDRLTVDLISDLGQSQSIAFTLRKLLPVISDRPLGHEAWQEIESFTHHLFASRVLPDLDLGFLDHEPSTDDATTALADLAASHIDHPVSIIAQGIQRICACGLLSGDQTAARMALTCLGGTEAQQERVLEVLASVIDERPRAVTQSLAALRDAVAPLVNSPNWMIRTTAASIVGCLGWGTPAKRVGEVSAFPYMVSLKPLAYNIDEDPSVTGPEADLRAYLLTLEALAEQSDVPVQNLIHRTAALMRTLCDPEFWSPQGENALRSNLEAADLRITYRRPRAAIARRAMFHLIGELTDLDYLTTDGIENLAGLLRVHDPKMLRLKPSHRPSHVVPIDDLGDHRIDFANWGDGAKSACEAHSERARLLPEKLGEATQIVQFRHNRIEEHREDALIPGNVALLRRGKAGELWGPVLGCPLSNYLDSAFETDPPPILVHNSERSGYDTPSPDWLALNPAIGRDLGWHYTGDIFRWTDDSGRTTVETVWWQDGYPETASPYSSSSEFGEGWTVMATIEALDQIRHRFGPLWRSVKVTRLLDGYPKGEAVLSSPT